MRVQFRTKKECSIFIPTILINVLHAQLTQCNIQLHARKNDFTNTVQKS